MSGFLVWLLFNRYTMGAALAVGLLAGAYIKGHSDASAKCHDAQLRAEIASLQRDMAAWKAADAVDKMLQDELERQSADLQQKVQDYEAELSKRPDNRCGLSPDDIGRLRVIDGQGAAGKPARPARLHGASGGSAGSGGG